MPANPFCEMADDGTPLYELKLGLVLYLAQPPLLSVASDVYGHYMKRCGSRMKAYRSTAPGNLPQTWDAEERRTFESTKLPNLYTKLDWGYALSDDEDVDSWMFMFHGFRPKSEPGKASFFRFDFDWQADLDFLRQFTVEISELTPFLSGFCGYFLQGRADLHYLVESYDRIFPIAHRYWGIEAHNLDVTVDYVLEGFKCVNWLTLIGEGLAQKNPGAVAAAQGAGSFAHQSRHGTVIEAQPRPAFGDRHKQEVLPGYQQVARALEPLQIQEHAALGGDRWTDENTMDYIRRWSIVGAV